MIFHYPCTLYQLQWKLNGKMWRKSKFIVCALTGSLVYTRESTTTEMAFMSFISALKLLKSSSLFLYWMMSLVIILYLRCWRNAFSMDVGLTNTVLRLTKISSSASVPYSLTFLHIFHWIVKTIKGWMMQLLTLISGLIKSFIFLR